MISSTYQKSFKVEIVKEQHDEGVARRLTCNSPLAPTVAFLKELPHSRISAWLSTDSGTWQLKTGLPSPFCFSEFFVLKLSTILW